MRDVCWLVDLDADGLVLEERTYQEAVGIEDGKYLGVNDFVVEDEGEAVSRGEHLAILLRSNCGRQIEEASA